MEFWQWLLLIACAPAALTLGWFVLGLLFSGIETLIFNYKWNRRN